MCTDTKGKCRKSNPTYLDIYIWLSIARDSGGVGCFCLMPRRGIRNKIQHLAIGAAGSFLVSVASSATTVIMFPTPRQGLQYQWVRKTTVPVLRMAHRKWKEMKQQPGILPGPGVPGCCLVSFHFLWAILSTSTLLDRSLLMGKKIALQFSQYTLVPGSAAE